MMMPLFASLALMTLYFLFQFVQASEPPRAAFVPSSSFLLFFFPSFLLSFFPAFLLFFFSSSSSSSSASASSSSSSNVHLCCGQP